MVSFLSDEETGDLVCIWSIVTPLMPHLRDSAGNSWFGPDSRTAGTGLLGLSQLPRYSEYTLDYQVVNESPF